MMMGDDLLARCLDRGESVLSKYSQTDRRQCGQYLTPIPVARYMARQLGVLPHSARILDPAVGTAVLLCAVVERCVIEGVPKEIRLVGYERDAHLLTKAVDCLEDARTYASLYGININYELHHADFMCAATRILTDRTGSGIYDEDVVFDGIIANPPYARLSITQDPGQDLIRYANIYAAFMSLCSRMLLPNGQACFLVPRSFCSGVRFNKLRRELLDRITPTRVHLFDSRTNLFRKDEVLQENIVFCFSGSPVMSPCNVDVEITSSLDHEDLIPARTELQLSLDKFLGSHNGELYFRLPTENPDICLMDSIDTWEGSLSAYNWGVSTGRVVPFRTCDLVSRPPNTDDQVEVAPLIWMNSVIPQRIEWPLSQTGKPQWLRVSPNTRKLLIPRENYVLIRRFSAKEQSRRLIAAPFLASNWKEQWFGVENHVNYIYGIEASLSPVITIGLAAVLNSTLLDRYFRIISGSTQINASDLRALPLPPWEIIEDIGVELQSLSVRGPIDIDRILETALDSRRGCLQ